MQPTFIQVTTKGGETILVNINEIDEISQIELPNHPTPEKYGAIIRMKREDDRYIHVEEDLTLVLLQNGMAIHTEDE